MNLGEFGVWQPGYATTPQMAKRIEDLGYATLWLGGPEPDLSGIDDLLAATDQLVVASSIYNIYRGDPERLAAAYRRIQRSYPDRLLLGLGVGHPEQVGDYRTPMAALNGFLDVLDEHGLPREKRALAALGPKMLALAAERSAGSVPYLVTPEHTRRARAALGSQGLLAPEQKVVLDSDPERARSLARPRIKHPYLGLVNYTNNLRRLGFTDEDLAGDGSDRLIDQLAVHGDAATVARGLREHLVAGANHVQIQVVGERSAPHPQMSDVLLQVYDEDAFRIYESLAEALGIAPR
ncbi:LLM class F420-dependent oxidoreductase [Mycolicibacterium conceptionense]|uniref:LLM class F420-dependent oxidoreductase n=1 Tax=Mycolicibacterium conceptionense TaxID=451644 RepID=A0A0U1DC77_9MYCO|nr:LLM class F420-dependent oxidoreductase [Mycolicibacterium conceptionense]OBJ98866.1 LLM class F420-dependent oxidoreductase [Mycolicibacterium conceptionense]OMB71229.1 LLM class F420-dependent oxidoreductase [Mycolicibacterium conceptionense]OMB88155.1 LLM class F420-dependent oxidoreductase [Mycolicibacterium conceptionense]ORV31584.1 LLM class F420-dependent oxidoreductase [Mycolicibacterium conceptionense]CQD11503.1 putative F420-dependent oxidoreductase, family [Mycolicibacterium conc